ncbi:hypothetical protein ACFVTC_40470 [Streptomyces sp. NPDC057950]|uniref:hypothetical protein n=1 Tax=Streptomyces sp. NPDC057950 TaxID=3346288 RepID=UPI0036E332D5
MSYSPLKKKALLSVGGAALATVAATGGLIANAPSASAMGNCYHYEQAGYAQTFTGASFTGDCFEWKIGGTLKELPSYIAYNTKSVRSWPLYAGQQFTMGNPEVGRYQVVAGIQYSSLGYPLSQSSYVV